MAGQMYFAPPARTSEVAADHHGVDRRPAGSVTFSNRLRSRSSSAVAETLGPEQRHPDEHGDEGARRAPRAPPPSGCSVTTNRTATNAHSQPGPSTPVDPAVGRPERWTSSVRPARTSSLLGSGGSVVGFLVPGRSTLCWRVTSTATPAAGPDNDWADITASEASLRRFLHGLPGVDQVGAEAARRRSRHPLDQDHGQGLRDRPGDLDGRPDHARGPGHPRQGPRAVRQGDAPRPRRPDLPVDGGGLRLPRHGRHRQGRPSGSSGVHVASVATAFPSGRAAMDVKLADTRDAVAAGADEIDMVIDRGAFLSGHYLAGVRGDRRRARGVRRPDGPAPTSR